jgi:hypothetical protein
MPLLRREATFGSVRLPCLRQSLSGMPPARGRILLGQSRTGTGTGRPRKSAFGRTLPSTEVRGDAARVQAPLLARITLGAPARTQRLGVSLPARPLLSGFSTPDRPLRVPPLQRPPLVAPAASPPGELATSGRPMPDTPYQVLQSVVERELSGPRQAVFDGMWGAGAGPSFQTLHPRSGSVPLAAIRAAKRSHCC